MDDRAVSAAVKAPSSWQLQNIVSTAQQTLQMLREEQGQIIETDTELLAALADEQVDVSRVLTLLLRGAIEAESLVEAAKTRMADQRQRMERFTRDQQSKRDLAQQVMEAVGLKSFKCAEATASLGIGQQKAIPTNEAEIEDEFITVTVTRAPNKRAALEALKAGRDVRGFVLSNLTTVLRITPR